MEPKMEDRLYQGFKEGFAEAASSWAEEFSVSQSHHMELADEYASNLANQAVQILVDLGVTVS